MKKNYLYYAITAVLLFLLMACGAAQLSKVCPPPEGKTSWICDKSAEAGVTPEQVYGWIFSATALAAVADVVKISWVCEFKQEISDWYVDMHPLTYDAVINKVIQEANLLKDPQKLLLIKSILNQNLTLYSSPAVIGEYDDWLLRAGSNKFDRDMFCK